MRKRQVVLRRASPEEPSRSSSTASSLTVRGVRYGECQKNHAAAVGGYAVDGCREFMASNGEEVSIVEKSKPRLFATVIHLLRLETRPVKTRPRVLSCCYCDKLQQRPDELGVTIRRKLDIFEITCEMYHYERTLLGNLKRRLWPRVKKKVYQRIMVTYCVHRSRTINFKVTSEKIIGDAITEKPVIESQQARADIRTTDTYRVRLNFMENTKNCFGYLALQSTCTAVEINMVVDSTYSNYQSPPPFLKLAFTKQYAVSEALLAKIVWRILTKPNSLLARILLSKYCYKTSFTNVSPGSAISHGLRGILVGRDLLLKHLGKVIGSGKKTNLWSDSCIHPETNLKPIGHVALQDKDLMVDDILTRETKE
ncbi:unnamed protein product [Brassica oleracea]